MALRATVKHESRRSIKQIVILSAAKDLRFRLLYATFNGARGFIPLKTSTNFGAFRPGFMQSEVSANVVLRRRDDGDRVGHR
jgi:hypothetical protein